MKWVLTVVYFLHLTSGLTAEEKCETLEIRIEVSGFEKRDNSAICYGVFNYDGYENVSGCSKGEPNAMRGKILINESSEEFVVASICLPSDIANSDELFAVKAFQDTPGFANSERDGELGYGLFIPSEPYDAICVSGPLSQDRPNWQLASTSLRILSESGAHCFLGE